MSMGYRLEIPTDLQPVPLEGIDRGLGQTLGNLPNLARRSALAHVHYRAHPSDKKSKPLHDLPHTIFRSAVNSNCKGGDIVKVQGCSKVEGEGQRRGGRLG